MTDQLPITADMLTYHTYVLDYEPPYAWSLLHDFYQAHPVPAQEWLTDQGLGRTFQLGEACGYFSAHICPEQAHFNVELAINTPADAQAVIARIRHMLDLDSSPALIEQHLQRHYPHLPLVKGLRIPRLWSTFEAGVRAILGQQISVGAASKLVNILVETAGRPIATSHGPCFLFPTVKALQDADLNVLPMVNARRDTLKRFVEWYGQAGALADAPEHWLSLKGIGPWTVNSAAMRGRGDSDMWIGGDLGIRKVVEAFDPADAFDPSLAAPWRSYLTQQLWSQPAAWAPSRRRS